VDPSFEFEKRRNIPVKYDRELWSQTITAMQVNIWKVFFTDGGYSYNLISGTVLYRTYIVTEPYLHQNELKLII
jgi:hypothetical protein